MRNINQNMLLSLRERVLHDPSMARRRQLNSNTTLQVCLEVSDLGRIFANLQNLSQVDPTQDTTDQLTLG